MKINKIIALILFVFLHTQLLSQKVVDIDLELVEKKLPFGLTKKVSLHKPQISIALSGGGARAISHIGVLKAIEELRIPIDHIVGTSMGSVIGGLYASGYSLADLDSLMTKTNWEELFFITGEDRRNLFVDQKVTEDKALLTVRLNGLSPVVPQSLNTGNKISNLLTSVTINSPLNQIKNYDNLLIKFRAVATELISGDRIVLSDGTLSETMRASSSVSFLLPPIKRDSLVLVDGGLVDNLPIKSAIELKPDFIIGSDATSTLRPVEDLIYPWDIADQIITIPSRKVWEENKNSADVLITHDLKNQKNNDFHNVEEIIEMGYKNSVKILNNVNKTLENKFLQKLSNDDEEFQKLQVRANRNKIEQFLWEKYKDKQSVLKSQILLDIYNLYCEGDYKSISAKVVIDSQKTLEVDYQLNSKITSVAFSGAESYSGEYLLNIYKNLINKPYNVHSLLQKTLSLIRNYRKDGYLSASIEKINFSDNGRLEIEINEGTISEMLIEGNYSTIPSIIEREFPNIPGSRLLKGEFKEGLQNLTATDLFDNLSVCILDDSSNTKKMRLRLSEKLPNVMRLGLRIDNEYFTQFAVDIRNENLFGTGSELGVSVSGGSRNMSYVLEHKTNRIFNTYLTYKAQAFYKFTDINQYADDNSKEVKRFSRSRIAEYRQRMYGGFIGLGAHLRRLGTLTAEAKYEVNEIDNVFSFAEDDEYRLSISSLKFRLQIDSQNKYPYPTKGVYMNTYYETAQKILGGDVSFAKFSFDYANHFTFGKKHTFTPKLIFGFADETLPLSQHFSFGGQSNFLGYRDHEFRGRQVFTASLQYRYNIPLNIYFETYLKIRYDLGSSWMNQEQIQFKDLKHGIGLSLSFDTPIGPADFSVGRSLYLKDTSPERILSRGPFMFYFTIGYYY